MAKKRISMKGMGADAFFETPVNQEADKPGTQHADKPASQEPSMPVSQQESMPVNQHASKPGYQYADKPARQPTGSTDEELIKATFYLRQEHIMKLERIRLKRKQNGIKIDKSALVREAIDLLEE
jgi:hypothetical protein